MALILAVRVVTGLDEALEHIARFGDHSDAIITRDPATAEAFVQAVDSSAVFVNASTRFNDGGQLGVGRRDCDQHAETPCTRSNGVA